MVRWLSIKDFAFYTGRTRQQVYRACMRGELCGVPMKIRLVPGRGQGGRQWEIAPESIFPFLDVSPVVCRDQELFFAAMQWRYPELNIKWEAKRA